MAHRAKIFLGVPHKGDVKFDTMASLFSNLSPDYDVALLGQRSAVLDFNRNAICKMALDHSASHVCFIDTDMVFPSDTISKLLAVNKPVVGVASRKKHFPLQYTIETDEPDGFRYIKDDELPQVPFKKIGGYQILVGTGVMLVDLQAIKDVPKPWFRFETYWNDDDCGYTGEDFYFCRKIWAAGLEVWCEPTIPVRHIGDYEY